MLDFGHDSIWRRTEVESVQMLVCAACVYSQRKEVELKLYGYHRCVVDRSVLWWQKWFTSSTRIFLGSARIFLGLLHELWRHFPLY